MAKRIIITCDRCNEIVVDRTNIGTDDTVDDLKPIVEELGMTTIEGRCVCTKCEKIHDNYMKDFWNTIKVSDITYGQIMERFTELAVSNQLMQEFGTPEDYRPSCPLQGGPDIPLGIIMWNKKKQAAVFDLTDYDNPQFYYVDKDGKPIDPPKHKNSNNPYAMVSEANKTLSNLLATNRDYKLMQLYYYPNIFVDSTGTIRGDVVQGWSVLENEIQQAIERGDNVVYLRDDNERVIYEVKITNTNEGSPK